MGTVRFSLSYGFIITVNDVNEYYNNILYEYGIMKANGIHKKLLIQLVNTLVLKQNYVSSKKWINSDQAIIVGKSNKSQRKCKKLRDNYQMPCKSIHCKKDN